MSDAVAVKASQPKTTERTTRSTGGSRKAAGSDESRSPSPRTATKTSSLPSPESPVTRSRKRAISIIEEEDAPDSTGGKSTHSRESSGASIQTTTYLCLCQPEPKIPRPRNAFILYRQHQQASVVAANPGLANPDISKIIGERWQAESDAVKQEWKDLAEDEKKRHQQQYPEYRYQPRRGGRRGSVSEATTPGEVSDKYRCQKCGGRNIRTPTTPATASLTTQPPSGASLPPPSPSNATSSTRYLPLMHNLSINSPAVRSMNNPEFPHVQRAGPRGRAGSINIRSSREMDVPMLSPMSPDAKRRRYNVNQATYIAPTARSGSGTPYPFSPHGRRESLPPPGQLLRSPPPHAGSMAMPPPARPGRSPNGHHDASLTLPPLQTTGDQSRSVEAMVMSMPYLGKIKVLGRIAPPLKAPAVGSPSAAVRGTIIAVEGEDVSTARTLSSWLEDFLSKSGEFTAKIEESPKAPTAEKKDIELGDYLDVVREWHDKSRDMIDFITTSPGPDTVPEKDASTMEVDKKDDSTSEDQAPSTEHPSPPPKPSTLPVVLLPAYQLCSADAYASRIAIQDAYSPADHWQWMATLWRGIVGPDFTIYVKDATTEELQREKHVEIKTEYRCLLVRKEKGKERVADSALRRVGFEVGEWVRSVAMQGKTG